MRVSIIIPVLNEAQHIVSTIQRLPDGVEVVVVDGGSTDATVAEVNNTRAKLTTSVPGRASQMNAGAALASTDILLFLHADTCLPNAFGEVMAQFERSDRVWGRFDVRLSGERSAFRVIEFMMNLRSRITGVCTGDQAMFIRTSIFRDIGGFAAIPLMEDIEISKRLKHLSPPFLTGASVVTSSRRWEQNGITRTVLLMWKLRFRYFMGASPDALVREYYRQGSSEQGRDVVPR